MNLMRWLSFLFLIGFSFCNCKEDNNLPTRCLPKPKLVIALQPFELIDTVLLKTLRNNLSDSLKGEVIILNSIALPPNAWYASRNRYIADSLLVFLKKEKKRDIIKIVGLTNEDISTAKGAHTNWGVMGLGYCPGVSCVISSFRVKGSSNNYRHFTDRMTKLALHELGHTFGVPHCQHMNCIMKDAEGKMNLDKAQFYCSECRSKINAKM
jgi:archaemetzincin